MKPNATVPLRKRLPLLTALAAVPLFVHAQVAPAPTERDLPPPARNAPVAVAAASSGNVVQMSPFEVNGEDDRGYQATSTLSGTRLNSKLEDLAASISVVTKQQLVDTAATDINDVFKYELNTEGTYQWTSFNVDRGVVTDDVQTDPANATRIRGLTAPNMAVNGFATSLPLDTYDVDAVEISRGPNSTVFGLGNTGGGVNIVKARANTTRDHTTFVLRGDSYGGRRASFDFNRVLAKNTFAVRLLGVYEDKGFVRKPSRDRTRRLEGAVTFRPFHNTTITGSFESYRNANSRPNALTPRDTISDWIASGRPTWDPTTQVVHFADGTSLGPVSTKADKTLPYGLATTNSSFVNSPSAYYDADGRLGLFMISRMPDSKGVGPNNVSGQARMLQNSTFYERNSSLYPLFNAPEITDKSIYDWTSLNLAAPNFGTKKGETSALQLEQVILNSQRQTLALQASWLYERISTRDRRFLGTGGASLQPYIDVNEKLLDGTPNPYFLRTYVGGSAPATKFGRSDSENYRGTLAYELDLTHESNWLRWLGRHQFSGYGEYRALRGGTLGFLDTIVSTPTWMGGPPKSRDNSTYRMYPRYYVGDANGQNIDYAPARTANPPYTYSMRYYNAKAGEWVNEDTTYDLFYDSGRRNRRLLSTYGANWQGFLLHDRIVPLLGIRRDYNRSRDGNNAIKPTVDSDGYYDLSPMESYGQYDWVQRHGKTDTEGIVVKPLRWLNLSYSQSNSFSPGSATYDVWGNPLPDPRGKTKDYGFELNLLGGRLSIVAKQYETIDIGRSTSELNTIVQRTVRMDRRSSGGDPGLTDWYRNELLIVHPDWTEDQLSAEVKAKTGVDPDFIRGHINKGHGDSSDSYSRGKEVEIVFNPNRFWTMRLTASQSIPINGVMSPAVQDYIAARWHTWQTITDPLTGLTWWDHPGDNNTVPADWYTNNVLANIKLATALQGKRRPQTREYHLSYLTNYRLEGLTANRWLRPLDIGGSIRWEDKGAIGFYGAAPDPDGVIREYDPNRPVWDKGHTFVDLNLRYRMKLFGGRVGCTLQLNVNNVFESGHLQPLAVNPDGRPWAFRIIDPRQFILTATFDL